MIRAVVTTEYQTSMNVVLVVHETRFEWLYARKARHLFQFPVSPLISCGFCSLQLIINISSSNRSAVTIFGFIMGAIRKDLFQVTPLALMLFSLQSLLSKLLPQPPHSLLHHLQFHNRLRLLAELDPKRPEQDRSHLLAG